MVDLSDAVDAHLAREDADALPIIAADLLARAGI